jgi:hypothetical protein
LKEYSYYEELADTFAKELTHDKLKKRKATTLSDKDKDKLFAMMLNSIGEDERLRVLLFCAKRGFIAYR